MINENEITYFGETDSRNKKLRFGIKAKDRTKHIYVIGKTGMGKSVLLENMAIQDIQNGNGFTFIDPHGGSTELLLDYIPKERINDVLYFAPFDMEFPIAFNIMEDIGVDKRHLVTNGLMSAFHKLFGEESFSDRMQYILQNTILALLEYPGATMLGVNRMLTDKAYRNMVVENVKDSSVKAYWTQEFASYTERFAAEATPAIQNKIGQFTSNPLVRNIIGQPRSSFDIRKMMDERKIMIINLSKGRVGEGNASLIGSMLITKIYLAAMSRADASAHDLKQLPNHYLFVDEFQSFANKSFADILSEARKYKLNLTIAHQYVEQMEEEVRAAVFGNVGTTIAFRVGAFDAEVLEKEFAPEFTAEDLVNLAIYQIYLKLMIDGVGSKPFSAKTLAPIPRPSVSYKKEVIEASRKQFSTPRAQVEKEIRDWHLPLTANQKAGNKPAQTFPFKSEIKPEIRSDVSKPLPPKMPTTEVKPLPKKAEPTFTADFKKTNLESVPKPISLNSLKQNVSAQKKILPRESNSPSPKNVNDLRSALQSIMKNPPKPIEISKTPEKISPLVIPTKQEVKPVLKVEPVEVKKEITNPIKGPNGEIKNLQEVPHDVLKKILDIDDIK